MTIRFCVIEKGLFPPAHPPHAHPRSERRKTLFLIGEPRVGFTFARLLAYRADGTSSQSHAEACVLGVFQTEHRPLTASVSLGPANW